MKRQLLLTFFSLFFIFSSSAQVEESGMSLSEKRQLKKALKVEAYTLDGNRHKGYLYYADFDKIFLTKNPLLSDSLLAINAQDLYQIKVISHIPFGKRFLGGITFSAAVMSLFTAEMYSHGDAIMIGPEAVIVAGTAIFGTPFSFLAAAVLPKERTDFEYRINGQADELDRARKFWKKKQISTINPRGESVNELMVIQDDKRLKYINEPLKTLHPEAVKTVHLMLGGTGTINNLGRQLDGIYGDAHGLESRYYRTDRMSFTGKIQFNASNKIRPYLSFTFGETGYGSGEILPEQEETEYIYTDYSVSYGQLGADYVFNPINNMSLSSFEFSVGGGLTLAKLNYDYNSNQKGFFTQSKNTSYTSFGLQIGGRVDYYFSRNISLNIGLTSNIMYPTKMDDMHYESTNAEALIFDGGHFNTSNVQMHFGLGLHL